MREKVLTFGPYQLFRTEKVLREHGRAVRLGSRALEILIALVERAGELVSKNELMDYAWPDTVVEENNLRVHVTALRKILGDGQGDARYIVNVAGRGYSFVAPVNEVDAAVGDNSAPEPTSLMPILPGPVTRLVGRESLIQHLISQVPRRRLVTIVGPGGVGKTTLALAVADRLSESYQRIYFVDLSVIEKPGQVPRAIATVLGVSVQADDPVRGLVSYLTDLGYLIVLDNCEHVVDVAAEIVERILRDAPRVNVIATSREPLLARGEQILSLSPLQVPPESEAMMVQTVMCYPAVQLFVERAKESSDEFLLTESNVEAVAAICRRLDGIPLAIELVAARVNLFGIEVLAQGFGDELLLATKGRRTAGVRHQSLRTALDWSYFILTPTEQLILRRLAVFRGSFSNESAMAVVGGTMASATMLEALMSLVTKSLLSTDITGPTIRYRFLHTTRAYASERLIDSDEFAEMRRRHAEHFRYLLEQALEHWSRMTRQEWLNQFGPMIDDVRAALEWAFSPGGNTELGAALTVASLPFGFQLSLIDETIRRAHLALEALASFSPSKPAWEMRITNALIGLCASTGASEEHILQTADRAVALAEQTGVAQDLIEPLTSRAGIQYEFGNLDAALESATALEATAKQIDDAMAILIADRVGAQVNHFRGNHKRARALAERVLRYPPRPMPLAYTQIPVDRQVSMRIVLSRMLWLEGYADQSQRLAGEAVLLAGSDGATSMCQALGMAACPIAFWRGDWESALDNSRRLVAHARRYTLKRWGQLGACYLSVAEDLIQQSVHHAPGGDSPALSPPIGAAFRELLCTVSGRWIDAQTRDRAQRGLCGWSGPEILRSAAASQLEGTSPDLAAAEETFLESLKIARQQNSLGWELRTVVSLAGLWRRQDRRAEACQALTSTYQRFNEGFETRDLKQARALMREFCGES